MPLYHFATTDLPGDTVAPEMSDINAAASLKSDAQFTGEDLSAGGAVDEEIMGSCSCHLGRARRPYLKSRSVRNRRVLCSVWVDVEHWFEEKKLFFGLLQYKQ
jgi:hypothetical protein